MCAGIADAEWHRVLVLSVLDTRPDYISFSISALIRRGKNCIQRPLIANFFFLADGVLKINDDVSQFETCYTQALLRVFLPL